MRENRNRAASAATHSPVARKRRERPSDLTFVLAMLVGGAAPGVGLYFATGGATWGGILAGFMFWPFAFVAALIVEVPSEAGAR